MTAIIQPLPAIVFGLRFTRGTDAPGTFLRLMVPIRFGHLIDETTRKVDGQVMTVCRFATDCDLIRRDDNLGITSEVLKHFLPFWHGTPLRRPSIVLRSCIRGVQTRSDSD